MSLVGPELDERGFQDLVDEAKRLIPTYCPEWTNHNLSDPGVALIELFAWMSEIVLYRLNQMPERYYTRFLDLMGIRPFAPSAATADVTFVLSSVRAEPVLIPTGTAVSTTPREGVEPVVFTTKADLVIAQPTLTAALTAPAGEERYTDVWASLRYELEGVNCFSSDPVRPGDAFYLGFENSVAGNVIRLAVSATIEGIGIDPRRPPLRWEIWDGDGWIRCLVADDTTGGLNRDGEITLVVPLRHEQLTLGTRRAHWVRLLLLPPRPGQPYYQASPLIRRVEVLSLGGTVTAEHSERAGTEQLGSSNGEPGQAFTTRYRPVLPREPGETVVVVSNGETVTWDEVIDFSGSNPDDRHFTWDSSSGTVTFGPRIRQPDGTVRQHGAIPPAGSEIGVAGYRFGGGAGGNVGAETLTALQTTIPYISGVYNPRPATGGVDAETIENAKLRGPLSLRTGERAVTASDYERLTLEASPAVARARCLPPAEQGGPVRLLVVPRVRRAAELLVLDDFALEDDLVATITEHLDERRVLGATVEIETPYFQGVSVAALITAVTGRPTGVVRQRVIDMLYGYVNPITGGDGNGWPFDADLNAATLATMIDAVDGVHRVDEVLLFEYDLRTGRRHGAGRETLRLDDHSLFLSAKHQVAVTVGRQRP
jgi:predicted phage baseplate assembly protein